MKLINRVTVVNYWVSTFLRKFEKFSKIDNKANNFVALLWLLSNGYVYR